MTKATRPIPEGYHSVTPYLTVKDAARAIDFYARAFGAQELMRMAGPGGRGVVHAELRIGDSVVMLSDEMPESACRAPQTLGGATGYLFLYVPDVDAACKRAVDAGAKVRMPVTDMFWGDRFGKLTDPFGHEWGLATHTEDLSPEEIGQRAAAFFASPR
ncbi:MAG: VOC family protein [Candidatus Rokubacteria bacterium]|nr:VOC family protein [Candidatus Rokubacteria bacterium]